METSSVRGVAWADQLAQIAADGQITSTTLVTGGFLDHNIKSGMFGIDIANRRARLFDHGRNKVTACTVRFVAEALVTALRMPEEERKNRRVHVAEVEYTGQELLRALESSTGDKWSVEEIDTYHAERKGRALRAEGDARSAYLNFVLSLSFNGCGSAVLSSGLKFGQGFPLERFNLEQIVEGIVQEVKRTWSLSGNRVANRLEVGGLPGRSSD